MDYCAFVVFFTFFTALAVFFGLQQAMSTSLEVIARKF
jgi:hypothetical protein